MTAIALELPVPSFASESWTASLPVLKTMPTNETAQPPTDEELAQAAQRGEIEAFEELVTRHRHRVYGRAFAMLQHHEDALDLCQGRVAENLAEAPSVSEQVEFCDLDDAPSHQPLPRSTSPPSPASRRIA